MRTHARTIGTGLLATLAAALLPGGGDVRAETQEASHVSLGWQAENAQAVVVGSVADASHAPGADVGSAAEEHGDELSVRVDRTVKGDVAAGSVLRVRVAGHAHAAADPSVPRLLFLRALPPAGPSAPAWETLTGAFGSRPVAAGTPEGRFPDLVKSYLAASAERDAAALAGVLVSWMDDADPGVAWSGATDFVRRTDLHGRLSETDRARIVEAFRRHPVGKNSKTALALAVAHSGSKDAARVLVESLLLPEGRRVRGSVAEALRRTRSPEAEGLLLRALDAGTPAQQTALLGALAVVGGADAAPKVETLLQSESSEVRTEAAAALGSLARNVRVNDPEARLNVARSVAARVAGPEADALPENEARAVLWTLAQLDEEAGVEALREVAANSAHPERKAWADRLLARPRQSLILRP